MGRGWWRRGGGINMSFGEDDEIGGFFSSAATLSAGYLLSGKACKERGRGAYIKYVSGNATTHNTAWRQIGKRRGERQSSANMSVSNHNIFLTGQPFQTHRSAHMQFVGADADLGTESVFEAVGELS